MLDADYVVVGGLQSADYAGGFQALFDVEEGAGLVEDVDVGVFHAGYHRGEAL